MGKGGLVKTWWWRLATSLLSCCSLNDLAASFVAFVAASLAAPLTNLSICWACSCSSRLSRSSAWAAVSWAVL